MIQEDRDYYEALLTMFASDGWKYFLEDQSNALFSLKETAYLDCLDQSSWHERRGQINKLTQLMNYDSFIKLSYENIEIEAKEENLEALH